MILYWLILSKFLEFNGNLHFEGFVCFRLSWLFILLFAVSDLLELRFFGGNLRWDTNAALWDAHSRTYKLLRLR